MAENYESTEGEEVVEGADSQWYASGPAGDYQDYQNYNNNMNFRPPSGYGGEHNPYAAVADGGGYGAPPGGGYGYNDQGYGAGYSGANMGYFNPELLNSVTSSPLAGMASAYADNFFRQAPIENMLQRWIFEYKYYFNVNNFYVSNKIGLILFPLRHKSWSRRIVKQGEVEGYLPPREDINAPDLYIPIMAAITFTLLHGFVMGTANKFTPEVLGRTATTTLFAILFEVLFIKFGFYLLSSIAIPVSFLDITAYSGYIFVGITLNAILGIFFGRIVYYTSTLITSLFMAIFMVKTFRILLLDRGAYDPSGMSNMRNYFIFSIALLQILIAFFLGVVV